MPNVNKNTKKIEHELGNVSQHKLDINSGGLTTCDPHSLSSTMPSPLLWFLPMEPLVTMRSLFLDLPESARALGSTAAGGRYCIELVGKVHLSSAHHKVYIRRWKMEWDYLTVVLGKHKTG